MKTKNVWKKYNKTQLEAVEKFSQDYIKFISQNKTERECCASAIKLAERAGYKSLESVISAGRELKPGNKIWAATHNKAVMLVCIGTQNLTCGLNILGAHIDSPRLDVKQNPLYESNDFAFLDTQYYGGIKNYQWVTVPLALHGVIAKKDGSVIDVVIGEDKNDPVFCVTDLLPHLGKDQLSKKASEAVEGENLDLLVGNRVITSTKGNHKEPIKDNVLSLLKKKYKISEEDFLSAELEAVPAGWARSLGFDSSMVIGYGQDDRVCAYTSLMAQLAVKQPKRTAVCILVDKEEIGSFGASGMHSAFFENTIAEIMELAGVDGMVNLKRALSSSMMLSSDVSAGFDPAYASVFDDKNAAYIGHGLVFNKYTGGRGKSGSNDASAEYVAHIRSVMDKAKVSYQTAELGKVDAGGGGTIAYIPAQYDMDVIDAGVAVLSMHAPWEVASKADIYEARMGYEAFLMNA